MSTETSPAIVNPAKASARDAVKANLGEYGLVIALIAIMLFFWYMTNGVLFYPVNLTNIVLQNSYIIVMALGMLLVIVAGHIDLSVGAVAGFIGAVAAILMVDYKMDPLLAGLLCIAFGGIIGGIQGYFIAFMKIPSFIVTLAGMLVFKGLLLNVLSGRSVGPFPEVFQKLSAGFIPDFIGPMTLVAPKLNAAGAAIPNSGVVLHSTTMLIGVLIVALMLYFALKSRKNRESHGYDAEPFGFFVAKNLVLAGIILFLMYKFASFKGLPNVLVVMGILIAAFVFVTTRMTFGRRIFALGATQRRRRCPASTPSG